MQVLQVGADVGLGAEGCRDGHTETARPAAEAMVVHGQKPWWVPRLCPGRLTARSVAFSLCTDFLSPEAPTSAQPLRLRFQWWLFLLMS